MVANHPNIQIEIGHGEQFTEQVVEEDHHDPYGYLKIRVDDSYLIGSEDSHVGVWITTDLIRLLAQTEAVFADEKDVVAFDNGPSYLVVEPSDEGDKTVNVTHCLLYSGVEDPDQRLPIEETFTIPKRGWTTELVQTAEEYYEEITDMNPKLEDNEFVQELRDEMASAKDLLEAYEDG